MSGAEVLLQVDDLVVEFNAGRGRKVHAVSGVSFDLIKGETLGLVGESGCGKTSTGRALLQLPRPTAGRVRFRGEELTTMSRAALRQMRAKMQIIFQDPISSLNPRRRVRDIVAAPLIVAGERDETSRTQRVRALLDAVGLDPDQALDRRPHEFSGGQCQRISIARALILEPEVLICDEPVSALDVSIQAQILNLLHAMKARYGLTMLFISHDLAVIKNVSDRVAVMYLGRICELAASDKLYSRPAHPYTVALLSAIPEPDPGKPLRPVGLTAAELPSPVDPPSGCRFRTRCPYAQAKCAEIVPELTEIEPGHTVACHFPLIGESAVAVGSAD